MATTLSFFALFISILAFLSASKTNHLSKMLMRSEAEREQLEQTICTLIDGDGELVKLALPPSAVRTTQTELVRREQSRLAYEIINTPGHPSFQRPPMPPEGTFDCPLESERRKQARDKAQRHRGGKFY
jgi:hypothetical protein